MTQPTDRPGIDQLRNLADRAERGPLTADEAARLREGIDQMHAWLITARAVAHSNRQHVRAIVPELEKAEANLTAIAAIFEGFGNLLATSSRDWAPYRVDAWLWAVVLGWDCEETEHDDTCVHGVLEEIAKDHDWSDEAVAKARSYRATVRAVLDEHGQTPA
jgi:hypothetical protein